MKKAVWIVSYPKSGNTWVRVFLSYLINKYKNQDSFINDIVIPIISQRTWIEDYLFLDTSELTHVETTRYTPWALAEYVLSEQGNPVFFKAHDAYRYTDIGEALYPAHISSGAIYIVRNVLDVAVSYAHHNKQTIDNTIASLSKENYALSANTSGIRMQLMQQLSSWSSHAKSWITQQEIPLLILRYEDLLTDTFNSFKKIIDFTGLCFTNEEIQNAIDQTSFAKLKEQEQKYGFRERIQGTSSFFREGKIGSWKTSLSEVQMKQLVDRHYEIMRHFNYIDDDGNVLV
jgi:hypothetical protein